LDRLGFSLVRDNQGTFSKARFLHNSDISW
jgi:hypothetical protein